MQKTALLLVVLAVALAIGLFFLSGTIPVPGSGEPLTSSIITIRNVPIKVDVADTPTKRQKGLAGRDALAPNQGMLFVFEKPDTYGIWMRGMLLPLDVIWIGADRRIVSIRQNVQPESYPEIYEPSVPALYILEIGAGFASSYNLAVGDLVSSQSNLLGTDLPQ